MRPASHLSVVRDGDLPPPLLPPEVDLSELPDALIDIRWACDSRFAFTASAEEFRAAVCLLLRSQQEKPAATLPTDDANLAFLAGFGRDLTGWRAVKDRALEGWTACSDGRLYHRGTAAKALDIWIKTLATQRKSAAGVAKRRKVEFNPEPFDKPIRAAVDALFMLNPRAPVLRNYLNAVADIDTDEAQAAIPGQTPGRSSAPTNGIESNRIESEGYICPAASAAGPESPSKDSGGRGAKAGNASSAIPVLPWPLNGFELFWAVWPYKVGRQEAAAAFTELIVHPPVEFPALLDAVRLYAERKPASHDWAYPATWLNRKRWLDVWPEPPPKPPYGGRHRLGSNRPFQPARLGAR